jgi:hypothetical protein
MRMAGPFLLDEGARRARAAVARIERRQRRRDLRPVGGKAQGALGDRDGGLEFAVGFERARAFVQRRGPVRVGLDGGKQLRRPWSRDRRARRSPRVRPA